MMDGEGIKSSDIEDWITELLPDFAVDMGIGQGVTFPSYGMSKYNQQNKAIAAMASNNNYNPSMWQHQQSVTQRMDSSLPTLFQEISHNQTPSSHMVSNLHQHQLLQNQVIEQGVERPNVYQFPTQSNSYNPNNLRQVPHQETFNVFQHTNQTTTLQKSSERQNGGRLVLPERVYPHELLTTSAFPMNPGNRLQTSLQESTPQPQSTNSVDWMDQAYYKISQMKEMFSPEVLTLYKRALEMRQTANNAETLNRCEKIRISAERVINFLRTSRSDLSRWRKEKLQQTMNDVVKYVQQASASNSLYQKQNQLIKPNNGISLENIIQFNNSTQPSFNQSNPIRSMSPSNQKDIPQAGFDQRALKMILNQTQLNSKNIFGQSAQSSVSTVSTALQNKQQNDQANKKRKSKHQVAQIKNEEKNSRRFAGINQGGSPLSPGAATPRNSWQSSSQKDLSSPSSSKFSRSAAVSVSASSSVFPSPLTPLTPCSKLVDFAKSPVSINESSKFLQNSVDPPLQDTSQNLIVADAQEVMESGANTKPTEKESSLDEEDNPVKRLVDAVMSMSPRALNSAIQDIDGVISLTDRMATNFIHGDHSKVFFQDLADDISKFIMPSMDKDQMEIETQTCVRGSGRRLKKGPIDMLLQEIKEINQRFMEVKVDMMNMDDVSRIGFDEGVFIRCSYVPVGPASQQMIHNLLLELFVPADYPRNSPTVSEKLPPGCGDPGEGKNLWMNAKSNFSLKLRKFSLPITVKQMARAWEDSAREVFLEYAEQMGGGNFSSKYYGGWDSFTVAF